jgi:hypothetical protein
MATQGKRNARTGFVGRPEDSQAILRVLGSFGFADLTSAMWGRAHP